MIAYCGSTPPLRRRTTIPGAIVTAAPAAASVATAVERFLATSAPLMYAAAGAPVFCAKSDKPNA
jgi:hypothetical protein